MDCCLSSPESDSASQMSSLELNDLLSNLGDSEFAFFSNLDNFDLDALRNLDLTLPTLPTQSSGSLSPVSSSSELSSWSPESQSELLVSPAPVVACAPEPMTSIQRGKRAHDDSDEEAQASKRVRQDEPSPPELPASNDGGAVSLLARAVLLANSLLCWAGVTPDSDPVKRAKQLRVLFKDRIRPYIIPWAQMRYVRDRHHVGTAGSLLTNEDQSAKQAKRHTVAEMLGEILCFPIQALSVPKVDPRVFEDMQKSRNARKTCESVLEGLHGSLKPYFVNPNLSPPLGPFRSHDEFYQFDKFATKIARLYRPTLTVDIYNEILRVFLSDCPTFIFRK
ncbi:hypothetical protein CAOG_05465 [Capsaspora owczarzaki ATCC 30864]|uniref:hypothetical protein n=1 Tax=Capsaspora owczarzaki (strain ATCC 30864) TaxID=595528 RepID=UPI0003521B10|nr:hypothetical protein CAOG_05465 [Capsaspora owczarzaki ATCC 30864]|eukprot:XP_004346138.2 hypothetical protein CAOG_05465 [Capsaspora owczarzaki ATCC 30864]